MNNTASPKLPPIVNETPTCKTCRFHRRDEIIGQPGQCAWAPPPALARLYAMLAAEPGTRIDYAQIFGEMPDALARGVCSEWSRRIDA
jgi:hypothetical protein